MRAEIDALVARAYVLSEDERRFIFTEKGYHRLPRLSAQEVRGAVIYPTRFQRGGPDMTTTETNLLTAGDLLRLYSKGVRGELVRGGAV